MVELRSLTCWYVSITGSLTHMYRHPLLTVPLHGTNVIHTVPMSSTRYQGHLHGTNVIYTVPMSFTRYQGHLHGTNVFYTVPRSSTRYQGHLHGTKVLSTVPSSKILHSVDYWVPRSRCWGDALVIATAYCLYSFLINSSDYCTIGYR